VRIESIEWDGANREHALIRATEREIDQAIRNAHRITRPTDHSMGGPVSNREAADAQWLYDHRDDLDGEEVEFEVVKPLSVTFAFRLPEDEANAIRSAAESAGLSVSEFIRSACREAAGAKQENPLAAVEEFAKLNFQFAEHLRTMADTLSRQSHHLIGH
jgi:hypothetical protein